MSERVYDALKARILSGEILPGEKLEPATFADALGSSITPVRDALHRLAGERLVETRTSEGFHLPLVTEPTLRDRYAWTAQAVRMIVHAWPRDRSMVAANSLPADVGRATRMLFALCAARSPNVHHSEQIDMANDHLAAPRAAEARVLSGLEDELRAMAVAFDNDPPSAFLKLVAAYFRRRTQSTSAIVQALYRASPRPKTIDI